MLDIAPAIDLPEHRAEPAVGRIQPILQRIHRAGTERSDAPDGDDAVGAGVAVQHKVNPDFPELHLLDLEPYQDPAAKPGGGQQQESAIA